MKESRMFDSFQEALEMTLKWAGWNTLSVHSIRIHKAEPHEFYSAEFSATNNKDYICTWEGSQVTFIEVPSLKEENENNFEGISRRR
jgi:hypothetical protein